MFTGIIETKAILKEIEHENTNIHFTFECNLTHEFKVDQSISHNGVCLTITEIFLPKKQYKVTAIDETLKKTNLKNLNISDAVNIERAMQYNARLDGHFVQGHVDAIAICKNIQNENGSIVFTFEHEIKFAKLLVEKGSVCINGVSLTVFNLSQNKFSVAIIPYTLEHTNFGNLQLENQVNIEYDILGKYINRNLELQSK